MEPKKKFEDLSEKEIDTFLKKLLKKKEKYIYDYEKKLKEKNKLSFPKRSVGV
jgi:hypothetical protein